MNLLNFVYIVTIRLTGCADGWVWAERRRVQDDSGFEPKQSEEWVCHLIR